MEDVDVREAVGLEAPDDVVAALDWLEANGFSVSMEGRGPNGGLALVLEADAAVVQIVRDRSQWFLYVGRDLVDFDIALAASTDRDRRSFPDPMPSGRLPEQVPHGVSWTEHLPAVLTWLRESRDDRAIALALAQRAVMFDPASKRNRRRLREAERLMTEPDAGA